MQLIVIEPHQAGGWVVRVPDDRPVTWHAATREGAERLARTRADADHEIVVRDAYHRIIPTAHTQRTPVGTAR